MFHCFIFLHCPLSGPDTKLRCNNVSRNFTFAVVLSQRKFGRQITLQLRKNHVLWLAGMEFVAMHRTGT